MAVDPLAAAQGVLTQGKNEILKSLGGVASYLTDANFNKAEKKAREAYSKADAALNRGDINGATTAIAVFKEELSDLKKADSIAAKAGELVKANDAIDKVVALSQVMHGRSPTLGEVTAMVGRQVVGKSPLGAVLNLVDSMGDKNIASKAVSKLYDFVIDKPAAKFDELPGIKQINQFTQEVASGVKEVTPDSVRNLVTGLANVPDALVGGFGEALKGFAGALTGKEPAGYKEGIRQVIEREVQSLLEGGATRDDIANYFMERADDPYGGIVDVTYPSGQIGPFRQEYPEFTYGDVYNTLISPDKKAPFSRNNISLLEQVESSLGIERPEPMEPTSTPPAPPSGEMTEQELRQSLLDYGLDYYDVITPPALDPLAPPSQPLNPFIPPAGPQSPENYPAPLPGSAGQPGIDPLREAALQPGDSVEAARASGYELPQAPYSGQPEYDPTNYDPIYGGAPPMGGGTPAYTPTPPAPVEPTPPAPAPVLDPLLPTSPRLGEEPLLDLDATPSPVVPQTAIREPVQTRPIDPLMPQITPFAQAPALPAATPAAYSAPALSRQNYVAFTEDMAPMSSPYGDTRGRARGVGEQQLERSIISDILKGGKQQPRKQTQMPALSPAMKTRIF